MDPPLIAQKLAYGELYGVIVHQGLRSNFDNGWAKTYTTEHITIDGNVGHPMQGLKSIEINGELQPNHVIKYSWVATFCNNEQKRGRKFIDITQRRPEVFMSDPYSIVKLVYPR